MNKIHRLHLIHLNARTKKLLKKYKYTAATILVVVMISAVGATYYGIDTHRASLAKAKVAAEQKRLEEQRAGEALAKKAANTATSKPNGPKIDENGNEVFKGGPDDPIASNPNIKKYSVSSDPRSTAYSLTPPKPSSKDINIRVTGPGQVKPGTIIEYNAVKQEKIYYGGDLIVSPSAVTITRNKMYGGWVPITVSSPDGRAVSPPSQPWYGGYTYGISVGLPYTSPTGPNTVFNALISVGVTVPVAGTYKHKIACYYSTNTESWEYNGFLTVTVVDEPTYPGPETYTGPGGN